jgi:hypothetical protein
MREKKKTKNSFLKFEKLLQKSSLAGKARQLIEIGGYPLKLPKKIRQGVKEAYFRLHKKFRQAK